jgi:hypothetical protein
MPTDPKDTVLPLTHASILVEVAGEARRFRVYSAVLLPPSQRGIRVRFDRPNSTPPTRRRYAEIERILHVPDHLYGEGNFSEKAVQQSKSGAELKSKLTREYPDYSAASLIDMSVPFGRFLPKARNPELSAERISPDLSLNSTAVQRLPAVLTRFF